jgi:hypothetical protein
VAAAPVVTPNVAVEAVAAVVVVAHAVVEERVATRLAVERLVQRKPSVHL